MDNFEEIDYKEVSHYLKMPKLSDEDIVLFDSVKKLLLDIAEPKIIARMENCEIVDGFYYLPELGLHLKSNDVNKYFVNVEKIGVVAATIGVAVDRKIAFYSKIDMVKAMVLDAMSNVLVENLVDNWEYKMHNEYPDYEFCMRYSCGYGDLSIEMQPQIIKALNATKLIGISVCKSNMMIPQKSISAFLGLTKTKNKDEKIDICQLCALQGKCTTKCRRALQNGKIK
ncbi:MAG: vitamin B12 dependent-methionine synthase activation domain-containing protein [Clostridia bacterium]